MTWHQLLTAVAKPFTLTKILSGKWPDQVLLQVWKLVIHTFQLVHISVWHKSSPCTSHPPLLRSSSWISDVWGRCKWAFLVLDQESSGTWRCFSLMPENLADCPHFSHQQAEKHTTMGLNVFRTVALTSLDIKSWCWSILLTSHSPCRTRCSLLTGQTCWETKHST